MNEDCLLLRKDLNRPLHPAQWPEGVSVVTLTPALLQPVHTLLRQGYADGAGSVESLEHWQQCLLHDADYDPHLCFVSLLDGEVVGVAHAWTSAYLKDLVVHPRMQGRGLGRALLSHVFSVFHSRGEASVDLKVMRHNHKARHLYHALGMTEVSAGSAVIAWPARHPRA